MGKYWFNKGMAFLPIFLVIWTYLTFTISYIIAVSRGDVDPGFPYISDTGARRPESSVFGQMLNISALVALGTLYIRYKQVQGYLEQLDAPKYKRVKLMNEIGLVLAFFVCLGLSLVANFQEISVLAVHLIGAAFAFGLGTIYEMVQCYITYKMHPEVNGKYIFHVRLTICILSVLIFIGEAIAASLTQNVDENSEMKFHWKPSDPSYAAHLASTILEWCLAGTFLAFFLTFIRDFQQITLKASTTLHRENLYHDQRDQLQEEEEDGEVEA